MGTFGLVGEVWSREFGGQVGNELSLHSYFFKSFQFWFGCHLRFSVAFGGVTHVISYLSYRLNE